MSIRADEWWGRKKKKKRRGGEGRRRFHPADFGGDDQTRIFGRYPALFASTPPWVRGGERRRKKGKKKEKEGVGRLPFSFSQSATGNLAPAQSWRFHDPWPHSAMSIALGGRRKEKKEKKGDE